MRWWHPQRGQVAPNEFIPVAEETGLIVPIGKWVIDTACRRAMAWREAGRVLRIAVNLSARQFRDKELLPTVVKALADHRLPGHLLELEITETVFMDSEDHVIATLNALRALGVQLALDDFGTGYSSLGYLERFSVDKLKIDRAFVNRVRADGSGDSVIANAIIAMAHGLELTVVAEGVETLEQYEYLRKQHCNEAQGYYIARPMPAEEFWRFVENAGRADATILRHPGAREQVEGGG